MLMLSLNVEMGASPALNTKSLADEPVTAVYSWSNRGHRWIPNGLSILGTCMSMDLRRLSIVAVATVAGVKGTCIED